MSLMSGFPQNNYHHHHHHPLHHTHTGGMVFANVAANDAPAAANYSAYGYAGTDTSPPYYWPPNALNDSTANTLRGDYAYGTNNTENNNSNQSIGNLNTSVVNTSDVLGVGCSPVRGVKRRNTANRKERRRTLSINTAFSDLRDCIPNVPSDTKLSKIKTLRLATSYIAYLMDILAKDDPNAIPEGGFKADVCKKMESRDERKKKEMANLLGPTGALMGGEQKKAKGRTGWPQHVWALELKQ